MYNIVNEFNQQQREQTQDLFLCTFSIIENRRLNRDVEVYRK